MSKTIDTDHTYICRAIYLCVREKEWQNIAPSQFTNTSQAEINTHAANSPDCVKIIIRWHSCHGGNDSSEPSASRGQRVWWLTKDCLWFDTVISATKGTDISPIHHRLAPLTSFLCSNSCLWSLACIFSPSSADSLSCLSLISSLNFYLLSCYDTCFSHIRFGLVFF